MRKFFRGGNGNSVNTSSFSATLSERSPKIIMIVIAVVLVVFIIIQFYHSFSNFKNQQLYLINGNSSANYMKTINGSLIPFPQNQPQGVEYSYSFWLFVQEWPTLSPLNPTTHACVLYKGTNYHTLQPTVTSGYNPVNIPSQAPGIYLNRETNNLTVFVNTLSSSSTVPLTSFDVENIPIQEWVHVTFVQTGNICNVYINGNIKKSITLENTPALNYGDLYVNAFGGYNGYISNLQYFGYTLKAYQIEKIVRNGPALTECIETKLPVPVKLGQDYWFIPN